ncbi:hypothetical protein [Flavobacterium muglaense]|uniref:Uncharacterized protein n=1 Tax=Flavobacterium muglaense TaxID=2764716 RepID=A0A923MW50_9FLAO|nr:hypothetical protein [Flavobacterium muglaense]MBC5836356.1 hypothetical protein [Flavobacterium muglaense]MBC5842886.1 hypothetical protein [Flavobacterium muglaense]
MNASEDKKLESIVNKAMKSSSLQSPTIDFTAQLMMQVSAMSQSKATIYKPLISRKGWSLIAALFALIIAYVLYGPQQETSSWMEMTNVNSVVMDKISSTAFGFSVSKIVLYAVSCLSVLVLVQVSFLKLHFDKRFHI